MTDLLHAAYPWLVLAVVVVITAILFARGGFWLLPPDNLHGLNDDEARMVAEERLLDAWSFADIVQRRRSR